MCPHKSLARIIFNITISKKVKLDLYSRLHPSYVIVKYKHIIHLPDGGMVSEYVYDWCGYAIQLYLTEVTLQYMPHSVEIMVLIHILVHVME